MTEGKLKELKDSGKSTTQLVIDGEITNLKDLYQYAQKLDTICPNRAEEEKDFIEKWSNQTKEMSLKELSNVRFDTEVNELILVGMLELGVNKITIGDLLNPMKKDPKYELIKRDFLNYMKHFLPPEE